MEEPAASAREFFAKHAAGYAKSAGHSSGSDLALLMERLAPESSARALDVATGTGFTAVELAKRVGQVVATDITKEMIDQATTIAAERGVGNISFERCEAGHLPHRNATFDIITSRRAPHHFDVPSFLSECARLLRPKGLLGVADMAPPTSGSSPYLNRIERLRDSSHRKALSPDEWTSAIEKSGLVVVSCERISKPYTFQEWLYPVAMGGREEAEVRHEFDTAPANVLEEMGVVRRDGRIDGWNKYWTVVVARNLGC